MLAFDTTARPTVQICELQGTVCVSVAANFPFGDGQGPAFSTVRERTRNEFFVARWTTPNLPGSRYRAEVRLNDVVLGFADIELVTRRRDLTAVPAADVGVVAGRVLAIRFRVEVPSVDEPPPPPIANLVTESLTVGNGTIVLTAPSVISLRPVIIGNVGYYEFDIYAAVSAGGPWPATASANASTYGAYSLYGPLSCEAQSYDVPGCSFSETVRVPANVPVFTFPIWGNGSVGGGLPFGFAIWPRIDYPSCPYGNGFVEIEGILLWCPIPPSTPPSP
jgi:hypothetical protein